MKLKSNRLLISLVGLVMATVPLTYAQAESINIYAWQNWSYEFVDNGTRDYDRLNSNGANIGFRSHMDTGIKGLQVGFRCEQFTYWGRNNELTGWCNRNSKISLLSDTMGEIMFAQWLLPYNDMMAARLDPFYDVGADSHSSIMGNIGGNAGGLIDGTGGDTGISAEYRAGGRDSSLSYNGSFDLDSVDGHRAGTLSFNRRQEGIVQYVWPNTLQMAGNPDGIQFRFAISSGDGLEASGVDTEAYGRTLDPRIISTGISYQHSMGNNQIWLAAAYEQHEDVSAANFNDARGVDSIFACNDSDDAGFRLAGHYTHDWSNGQSTSIGAMYEMLEYDASCMRHTGNGNTQPFTAGNVPIWTGVERDSWMVSGKHVFGNGIDFRFSYMNADEWDCEPGVCTAADERDTDADAINFGLFYTLPEGTELRATYSEVSNSNNAGYNFGNSAAPNPERRNMMGDLVPVSGEDIEMIAIGIVHRFD